MIFAINHPTCKNKIEPKKFSFLTNLYRCLLTKSLDTPKLYETSSGRQDHQRHASRPPISIPSIEPDSAARLSTGYVPRGVSKFASL
jgi:hypothetical protein